MPILGESRREQVFESANAAGCRRSGEIDSGTALNQPVHCNEFSVRERRQHRRIGIRTIRTKQGNQGKHFALLSWDLSRADKPQGFVHTRSIFFGPGIKKDSGNLDDIVRHRIVADRVFRDELQQRWIAEIFSFGKEHMLMHESRVVAQMRLQTNGIPGVNELHSLEKCRVFDSLVEWRTFRLESAWRRAKLP